MFSRSLLFVSRLASRLKTSNVTSCKSANTTKCFLFFCFLLFQIMNLWELVGWFLQWCCSSWASQSLSVSAWPSKDTARVQMCKRKSVSGLYSLCAQTHLTAPLFPSEVSEGATQMLLVQSQHIYAPCITAIWPLYLKSVSFQGSSSYLPAHAAVATRSPETKTCQ